MAHTIQKVGVIGAGQMGNGIAHVCALAGLDVKLSDVSPDRVKAGIATINGNLARQASRQRITEEQRQAAIKRISAADTLAAFGDCDIVMKGGPGRISFHMDEVVPGDGMLDYRAYLRELNALGRDVPLMIEHFTPPEYDRARDYIRRVGTAEGIET